ncbi:MAG: VanW family protein, partial [Clostridiales bacterium]|nr:VanW family protein [Clostridiales bacterium]
FYSVIKTLNAGTEVSVTGKELGWFKITDGAAAGYITDTLVKITDPTAAAEYNPVKTNYEKLASYTTKFSASDVNRNHNMELAAYKNQVILKPGGAFSFNTNTGNSTKTANGWRESIIIVDSERVKGIGGGICQCSTTIYSAVKQIPKLTILERRPHSIPVGYVPRENEAMVNYGTSDLRFRNDTGFDVFICTLIDHAAGSLTCAVYKVNPKVNPTPKVVVDGKRVAFNVAPRIIDDRLYVEMRSIFEYLGYAVTYDAATKATKMKKGTVEFILENGVDSKNIISVKNGVRSIVPLTYPIYIVADRTMFSLRMAGELLNYNVGWDDKSKTASLTLQG